jgi:hypothetical protein
MLYLVLPPVIHDEPIAQYWKIVKKDYRYHTSPLIDYRDNPESWVECGKVNASTREVSYLDNTKALSCFKECDIYPGITVSI